MASRAWEMRCSLPLAGRDEPQTSMAMPLRRRAWARSASPAGSRMGRPMNWKTVASERRAAKSSTGVPRVWKARFQSLTAVILEMRSPMPESQRTLGAAWVMVVSMTTPKGMALGRERRLASRVRLDWGLQKPSLEREVGMAM